MRQELIHVLKHMTDEQTIKNFLFQLTYDQRDQLFHLLSLTSESTQDKWLMIYSNAFKLN